jgi:hypothetical protein
MKKKKSKVARVVVKKVTKLAEDHHILETDQEVHGPLPFSPESLPLEVTPDATEPEKRGFWAWIFGE